MTGCCTQRRLSAQCRVSTVREEVEGLRLGGGNENPLRQQLRQGVVEARVSVVRAVQGEYR